MDDKGVPERFYRIRDVARLLGVYDSEVTKMISRGELPAFKGDGRYWLIRPADVQALLQIQLNIRDLTEIRRLRDELERERRQLRDELAAERDHSLIAAIRSLGLENALAELAADELAEYAWSNMLWAKRQEVQRALDIRDNPVPSERPAGVPDRASYRVISTGIGRVAVWYWSTPKGWRARAGGPRRMAVCFADTMQKASRAAADQARFYYGQPSRVLSARTRYLVLRRDNFTCRYCGRKAPDVQLHVDHAVALAVGGGNEADNLVTACDECNLGKGALE